MNGRAAWQIPAAALALLVLLVLAWVAALAGALWLDLSADERLAWHALWSPRAGLLLLFGLLLPALLAALVWPWAGGWIRAAGRLRDEVGVASAVHAAHRLSVAGPRPMRELAVAVQRLADAHAAVRDEVGARIAEAQARLAEETRRLGALMSELPQAVLVCNGEGRVLLYNARAAQLFSEAEGAATPIGLGRALASLLDAGAVEHARRQVRRRLQQGAAHAAAQLVTRRGSVLLRVQMVPTEAAAADASGHVLIVEDITRSLDALSRRDTMLQRLTHGSRSTLANLRAAAQTLRQYPAMDAARRERFTAVVHDEAERLAQQLGEVLSEQGGEPGQAWPLEEVQLGDLVFALQHAGAAAPVRCRFDGRGEQVWLEADSHAVVQLLAHLLGRIGEHAAVAEVELEAIEQGRLLRLDLVWAGTPPESSQLAAWERDTLATAAGALTVRELLDRHGAELWSAADRTSGSARLCLQLSASKLTPPSGAARLPGRPIAYDFDLFHQRGQSAALDDTPLAALACTVFDTETTGLRPSEGDEIIAIGAVRIVNGRLLEHERFDRLTRPRRPVRASAEAVHGISNERLQGEPPLEQVLPPFARFCDGTVLVAHNAAFDMRFLELARERTGVGFDQPVLDTLLLASVVHSGHGAAEHQLEQLAARLGVPVSGRHQALGDAIVTAQVFLKLLPLLAERGITTLGQAREASRTSPLARETF